MLILSIVQQLIGRKIIFFENWGGGGHNCESHAPSLKSGVGWGIFTPIPQDLRQRLNIKLRIDNHEVVFVVLAASLV